MADPIAEWMRAGKYLPDVLRDFHDQKDVFKAMHDLQKPAGPMDAVSGAYDLSFVTGQCYVIDRFLWFMARRGYTLQRSRARLPFRDLSADVNAATEKRNAHDMALLDSYIAAAIPVNHGKAGDEGGKEEALRLAGAAGLDPDPDVVACGVAASDMDHGNGIDLVARDPDESEDQATLRTAAQFLREHNLISIAWQVDAVRRKLPAPGVKEGGDAQG